MYVSSNYHVSKADGEPGALFATNLAGHSTQPNRCKRTQIRKNVFFCRETSLLLLLLFLNILNIVAVMLSSILFEEITGAQAQRCIQVL